MTTEGKRASTRAPARRQLARCNPAMLEWARKTAGLTADKAAKRLRLKPEILGAWEAGTGRPTIPQLRRLAAAYKRPLASFYLPRPPRDFAVAKDHRRLPGDAPVAYSSALLFALRAGDYRRDVILGLEPETSRSPLVGGHTMDFGPERLAAAAREMLGVSLADQAGWKDQYAALNSWRNALEAQGVLVFHFSDVEVDEVRGYSISHPVLPVIGLNGSDSVNGRIFTLIHELGHLILGDGGSCDLADFTELTRPQVPVEVYANAFAGALLLPRPALLADPMVSRATRETLWDKAELRRLARRFHVSAEVVLRRLLIVGKTDDHFYGAWREEALTLERRDQGGSGRPSVAVMTVRDVGKPFARAVLDAYRSDAITGSDVSEYLGVRLKHLPAIEARLAGPDLLTGGDL